jgi:competence protein ComEC
MYENINYDNLNHSTSNKIKDILFKYKKHLIVLACFVLVLVLVLIVALKKPSTNLTKYSDIERIMVINAQNYIKNNDVKGNYYVSLNNLNIKIDEKLKCNFLSGVYKQGDNYYPYLICNDYNSRAVQDILEENSKNKNYGELKGSNPYFVSETSYLEEGLKKSDYQVNIKGDDIDNGLNIVTYYINDNGKNIGELKRIVIAEDIVGGVPVLTLLGDKTRTIPKGSIYSDQGYKAIDEKDGNITDKVKVTGSVNTSEPGTYKLTYSVTNSRGRTASVERTVVVNESSNIDLVMSHKLDPSTIATKSVTMTVSISGNGYKYTVLPDNSESKSSEVNYTVYKNGTYDFIVYDTNDNSEVYSVNVSNIDNTPPKGSCTLAYDNDKLKVSIKASATTGIKNYEILNKSDVILKTTDTEVLIDGNYDDVKVRATGNNDIKATFNCNVTDSGILKIYYLGLGRYDGHLIMGNNTVIFIDSGYESNAKKALEFMKSIGVTKIDAIVGSHLHDNHIWGQKYLINNIEVKHAYYGDDPRDCISRKTCGPSDNSDPTTVVQALESHNIPITILAPGSTNVKIGNLTFDILSPINKKTKSESAYVANVNSMNMILKYGNTRFYFSGDGIQEKDILNNYDPSMLKVDVLKYPHHGQHALSQNFLNITSPKYVIIPNSSATALNAETKPRINKIGAQVYATGSDTNKSILVTSDGKNVTLTRLPN